MTHFGTFRLRNERLLNQYGIEGTDDATTRVFWSYECVVEHGIECRLE